MEPQTLISASAARNKINNANTETSLQEWDVIVKTIGNAVERNNDNAYFKRISTPNQNKLRGLGYAIESDPDPRESGGYFVKW